MIDNESFMNRAKHKIDVMTAFVPENMTRTEIATIAIATGMSVAAQVLESLDDLSIRVQLAEVLHEVAEKLVRELRQ